MSEAPARPSAGVTKLGPWIALTLAGLLAATLILHVGRGTTWFFDEWDWILHRRTGGVDDLLANHNGHLIALPLLAYKATWATVGLHGYDALRVLTVMVHLATCVVLFLLLRRRIWVWLALGAAIAVMFLGSAWQDLLWPSQLQYFGSMLGGLTALLLVERGDRAGDVGATLSLLVALACSGIGLPFLGAIGLELLLQRRTWRRLWVVLLPAAAYVLWYLNYGSSQAKSSNVHLVAGYVERAAASATGALLGRDSGAGHWLLGAVGIVVVVTLAVRRSISPRMAALLALPLSFWILTALSRADSNEPGASRYLYPGAIFILLVLAQLVDDPSWPRTDRGRAVAATVAVGLLLVSLVGNVDQLRDGGAQLRSVSDYVQAELRAVELARGRVRSDFRPDTARAPQVTAGAFLSAVDALGSPAYSVARVRQAPESVRIAADRVLLDALGVRSQRAVAADGCTAVPAEGGEASKDLSAEAVNLVIVAGDDHVDVSVRNLAAAYEAPPFVTVAPGTTRRIDLPAVASGPWSIHLASSSGFSTCGSGS